MKEGNVQDGAVESAVEAQWNGGGSQWVGSEWLGRSSGTAVQWSMKVPVVIMSKVA